LDPIHNPQADFEQIKQRVMTAFPQHTVEIFSDDDQSLLGCVECTARLFNRAAVVIGKHGG
jgi:hypothetical protein